MYFFFTDLIKSTFPSFPTNNRSIFFLCANQVSKNMAYNNKQTTILSLSGKLDFALIPSTTVSTVTQINDAIEPYLNSNHEIPAITTTIPVTTGFVAKNTPSIVAIPLPPLNLYTIG